LNCVRTWTGGLRSFWEESIPIEGLVLTFNVRRSPFTVQRSTVGRIGVCVNYTKRIPDRFQVCLNRMDQTANGERQTLNVDASLQAEFGKAWMVIGTTTERPKILSIFLSDR
jgi:hypothetical protein